jgi:hypothetical protein
MCDEADILEKKRKNQKKEYECKRCSYTTTREKHFHRHNQSQKHIRKLPFSPQNTMMKTEFKCIHCNSEFNSFNLFNHHSKRTCVFKCPSEGCGKKYNSPQALKRHIVGWRPSDQPQDKPCVDDPEYDKSPSSYREKREEQKLKQFAIDEGFTSIEEYREDKLDEVSRIFLRLYKLPTFMDWEMGDFYYPNEKAEYFLNGIKTKYNEEELEYLFNTL